MYLRRFSLKNHPLPKDAQGASFFTETQGFKRLEWAFDTLLDDCGLNILSAAPGLGKTASIRELCSRLPKPDYRVFYLCDTAVAPLDLYRMLAVDLGVRASHRRSQLWADIKSEIMKLVDEQGVTPVLVLDEAQHLTDRFLIDLSGFLNFAFDSRDLFPMWLVGMPQILGRLRMQQHAALAMRVGSHVHLDALGHDELVALVRHGLEAAGAKEKLIADPAMELLVRTSRGIPRIASKLLRAALREAHRRDQRFVDERALEAAIELVGLAVEAAS